MKADKSEVKEVLDNLIKEKKKDHLVLVEQAAVANEKLTSSPTWNIYLQEIQAMIDKAENSLKTFKEQLCNPMVVNPDEVQLIRNQIFIYTERLTSLREVLDFPKRIIDDGQAAKDSY